ncbi:hypothetical protein D3C87_1672390 [compost metagenome]
MGNAINEPVELIICLFKFCYFMPEVNFRFVGIIGIFDRVVELEVIPWLGDVPVNIPMVDCIRQRLYISVTS